MVLRVKPTPTRFPTNTLYTPMNNTLLHSISRVAAVLIKETVVMARRKKKLALFMKRIINFLQMIRCKEVLLRKDWRIINLLRVAGLQEDGPG